MFVVKMNRHGNPEKHSYIQGLYESEVNAYYAGEIEEYWRGGKYEKEIIHFRYHEIGEIDSQKEKWYIRNVIGADYDD